MGSRFAAGQVKGHHQIPVICLVPDNTLSHLNRPVLGILIR